MEDRFAARVTNKKVAHDLRVLADFTQIWCDGHHAEETRSRVTTQGAELGTYGRKAPTLCAECAEHLAYAEKRRAACPHDPKPFCAHCETHCYRSVESDWQKQMMRYSGPRSWKKGHTIDGIKHALEARKFRKQMAEKAAQTSGRTR